MQEAMVNGSSSCIYKLFTLKCKKDYTGLVYQRPAVERYLEHLAELRSSSSTADYEGMKRQATADEWLFLPWITSDGVVEKAELEAVEDHEIKRAGNSWNIMGNPYVKTAPSQAAKGKVAVRKPAKNTAVYLAAWCLKNGTLQHSPSFITLLLTASVFVVHSMRVLLSLNTTILRSMRHSVFKITALESKESIQCNLKKAVKWIKKQKGNWLLFKVVHKKARASKRSATYLKLQAWADSSVLTEICRVLSVPDLTRLWWIIYRQNQDQDQHKFQTIKKELRQRGFKWYPDCNMVLKIPPEVKGQIAWAALPADNDHQG